jgi:hypothetical protein
MTDWAPYIITHLYLMGVCLAAIVWGAFKHDTPSYAENRGKFAIIGFFFVWVWPVMMPLFLITLIFRWRDTA